MKVHENHTVSRSLSTSRCTLTVEQIGRVFEDNFGIILLISP